MRPTPRIVVSVSPRVLGDALSVVLREHGLAVDVLPEDDVAGGGVTGERFDLALTSGPLPREVVADVVVVLPGFPGEIPVRVLRSSHPEERRHLRTLDGLLGLVTDLLEDLR